MVPPLVHGVVAIGVAALQLAAPSRVVVLPTTVEGDAPTTVAKKFDDASSAAIGDAGAETVSTPDGCSNETCAAEAVGPGGYVLTSTVAVKGSDYTITTRVTDGAGKVIDEQTEPCEICTYEEAAETLQEMVAKSVGPIAEAAPPPPPPGDSNPPPPPPPTTAPATPNDGGPNPKVLGGVGIAATAVGAGAIVGGIVLFVLNERPVKNNCEGPHIDADGDCEFRYNTLGGGAGLAIGGAVALGVGVGLLLLKRGGNSGGGSAKVDVSASRGGLRLRF